MIFLKIIINSELENFTFYMKTRHTLKIIRKPSIPINTRKKQ